MNSCCEAYRALRGEEQGYTHRHCGTHKSLHQRFASGLDLGGVGIRFKGEMDDEYK